MPRANYPGLGSYFLEERRTFSISRRCSWFLCFVPLLLTASMVGCGFGQPEPDAQVVAANNRILRDAASDVVSLRISDTDGKIDDVVRECSYISGVVGDFPIIYINWDLPPGDTETALTDIEGRLRGLGYSRGEDRNFTEIGGVPGSRSPMMRFSRRDSTSTLQVSVFLFTPEAERIQDAEIREWAVPNRLRLWIEVEPSGCE